MRHTLLLTVVTTATLLLTSTAALAHASLDVAELPAGSTTDVAMRVPIERSGVGNGTIEVLAPEGFVVEACVEDAGWSCTVEEQAEGTVVTFARGDGDERLEQFGLTLTAPDDERDDVLPTVQTYTDGVEVAWIGDGGDRPAPSVTVGPPDADVVANTDEVDDDPIGEDQFDDDPPAEEEPETSAPADAEPDGTDGTGGTDDEEPETSAPAEPDAPTDDEVAADQPAADDTADDTADDNTLATLQVVALVVAVALVAAIALRRSGRLGGG